jgi:hypothetical protein
MHEWNCPNRRSDRMQQMLDLLKERTSKEFSDLSPPAE